MGKSSPSPPTPPDPFAVAQAQQGLNTNMLEEQQAASQTGQFGPFGSLQYYQTGVGPNGVPLYTELQQLSPTEMNLLGEMQGGQLMGGLAGANLMSESAPMYSAGVPDFMQGANSMTNQMMGHELSYMEPFFNNQTSQLDTQLRNQGIMPGTPAYQQQMMQAETNQGQTMNQFLAMAEPQAFSQAIQQYTLPGQMAQQLLGMAQPTLPQQLNTIQASGQPANLIGAVGQSEQAQMAAYQAQLAQQNAMMQGIAGLGSSALMANALSSSAGAGAAGGMGKGAGDAAVGALALA